MKTCLSIFIATLALLFGSGVSAQPRVLASLKPLQLVAAAVLGDVAQPALIAPSSGGHHDHALRPSERLRLNEADILLWVGPELESWLAGVATSINAAELRANALPDLVRHEVGGALDPHIWLDPVNAGLLATALAELLTEIDPANAARYAANLMAFEEALAGLDADIRADLARGAGLPYAVYHDAFRYFEARYGLAHVTAFTDNEDVMPGIRQLLAIRAQLEQTGASCILVEPGVNVAQVRNVVEIDAMRYVEVDVLGQDIAPAPGAYAELLRGVADAMLDCRGRHD